MSWTVDRWRRLERFEQRFGDRLETPPRGVRTLRQVHGRIIHRVSEIECGATEGDGLMTYRGGALVGVWTADCVPVHVVAAAFGVAAAVHCGWRGSAAGILAVTLERLAADWAVAARDLEAALGPSIGGCCYEVGDEIESAFVSRAGGDLGRTGFERRGASLYLDLRAFLRAELLELGVRSVDSVGPCTACSPDVLHSYRMGARNGRQLSWLGWVSQSGE
jgi:YfiH family protein